MAASLDDRDLRLGVGALLFAIGVVLVFVRMNAGDWGDFPLLVVVLVPFVASLSLLRAQPPAADAPAPLVSLLSGLAFLFGAISVAQLASLVTDHASNGTQTWEATLVVVLGVALTRRWRSAVVGLLTIGAVVLLVLAATHWIFGAYHLATYRWIALALAVVFGLGAMSVANWPRLSSVLGVAAGLLLIFIGGSLLVAVFVGLFASFERLGNGATGGTSASFWWKLVLVAGGLTLAAAAAIRRDPGVGWAAGVVLALFVYLAGFVSPHISVSLFSANNAPPTIAQPSIVGWPLAFLIIAAVALAAALLSGRGGPGGPLSRSPDLLATAALLMLLATTLTEVRMADSWSHLALFLFVGVPTLFTFACVAAQPPADTSPPWSLSLLAIVALIYTADWVDRFTALIHTPIGHAGTATWALAFVTAAGLVLLMRCRSAALVLLTYFFGAATVLVALSWLFSPTVHTFEYVLVILGGVYVVIGLRAPQWPRLEAVSGVAGGLAVIVALALLALSIAVGLVSNGLKSFGTAYAPTTSFAGGWMGVALATTFVLAAIAARRREAGPAYVAALTTLAFVLLDTARQNGHAQSLAIWPLVLVVGGALVAATGLVGPRRD
jgi:hypothetical protein